MLNKKFFILPILAFFTFGACFSQDKEPMVLTLDKALDCAVENSRTLKSAKIDLEIAERSKKYRWNVFIPTVSGSFTAARTNDIDSTLQQMNASSQMMGMIKGLHAGSAATDPLTAGILSKIPNPTIVEETEKGHWAMVGNVSASLNLSLAYIGSIRATVKSYEIGEITWENAVRDLKRNVTKLFYGLLLQQESLKITEASLENAKQRARQAEINFRNGSIPEIQLLQAQVNYQNQIPNVESSQVSLAQQLDTFAFLIGLPLNQKITLDGKIEPVYVDLNFDDLMSKYAENNTDIVTLRKNLELLKLNKSSLDMSIFTPALALSYNYNPTRALMQEDGDWNDGGRFSATLAWTISDMLPFSAKKLQSKQLADNISKLEVSLEQLLQNNELTIKKSLDSLEQSKKNIETSQRNIMLAQKSYDMNTVSYRNGQTEFLNWKEAETQYNQSKLGLLNAQFNYMTQLMDLEYILNTTLVK